jgi:isopentenyl phosphate kinase
MDLEDLVIEPMVVQLLENAVHIREVRISNCHKRDKSEKAINGKKIGTVLRAE